MKRSKWALIVSSLLVFSAGISIGRLLRSIHPPPREPTWLAEELKLTPDQQRQMREVWNSVRGNVRDFPGEERRQLSEKRDASVRELLSQDQLERYEEIQETYEREKEELMRTWKAPMEEAVEKTRQILSDEQFQQFEELRKKRWKNGHGHRRGGRDSKSHRQPREE